MEGQRDWSRRKQKRDVEVDKGMKQGKEGKVIEQVNRVPDRKTERRMENLTEGQRTMGMGISRDG